MQATTDNEREAKVEATRSMKMMEDEIATLEKGRPNFKKDVPYLKHEGPYICDESLRALKEKIGELEKEAKVAENKATKFMAEVAQLMDELNAAHKASSNAGKERALLCASQIILPLSHPGSLGVRGKMCVIKKGGALEKRVISEII